MFTIVQNRCSRSAEYATKKDLDNPLFKTMIDEWSADKGSRDSQRPIKDSLLVGMALKNVKDFTDDHAGI